MIVTRIVTLYNIPDKILSPNAHRVYEGIEHLLENYTGINVETFDDTQFIKIDMHLDLKVQLNQSTLAPLDTPKYNYCSIWNGSKFYYYFIDNRIWKGKECCLLSMTIDSANTYFGNLASGGAFNENVIFSPRTRVLREHKIRFITSGEKLLPIIDYYPEGINPVLYRKETSDINIDHEEYTDENDNHYTSNIRWNLMYVTNNDENSDLKANPLKVYLIPNERVRLRQASSNNESVPMDLLDTAKIYIKPNGTSTIDGYVISPSSTQFSFIYYDTNDGWKLVFTNGLNSGNADSITLSAGTVTMTGIQRFGTLLASSSAGKFILNQANLALKMTAAANLFSIVEDFFFIGSNSDIKYLIGLNEFDLTDSKIVKLIACPYCPIPIYPSSGNLEIEGDVEYACGRLLVKNKQFENELHYPNIECPDAYVANHTQPYHAPVATDTRDSDEEPKLYSSEFFTYKLVYDSFAKEILLEGLEQEVDDYGLTIVYKQTSTINSKFAFKIPDLVFLFANDDYPEYLVCARNNERTIYSNSYINYLRTGYNYDVKNKEAKNTMNWINLGIGALSTITSTGVSVATGNSFMAAGAVRSAFSTASSIINNIHQSAQAERDLRQKQESLKQQSLSVSGSDDIDLLEFYNDNRLHIITYSPNHYTTNMLKDLFYYFGYATNERKVPDINSRYWFNYIQCEIEFATGNLQWEEFMDDLRQKFLEGITIFHRHNNEYDLNQEKANWEVDIL